LGGNFVKEPQREKFCRVVAATPELHSYTAPFFAEKMGNDGKMR